MLAGSGGLLASQLAFLLRPSSGVDAADDDAGGVWRTGASGAKVAPCCGPVPRRCAFQVAQPRLMASFASFAACCLLSLSAMLAFALFHSIEVCVCPVEPAPGDEEERTLSESLEGTA